MVRCDADRKNTAAELTSDQIGSDLGASQTLSGTFLLFAIDRECVPGGLNAKSLCTDGRRTRMLRERRGQSVMTGFLTTGKDEEPYK